MRRLALTPGRLDWLVTAVLALGAVIWLLGVEGRQGIGRDEAQYFRAGERSNSHNDRMSKLATAVYQICDPGTPKLA